MSVNKEIIHEIIKRLSLVYSPRQIYLFGSFAWGTPDDASDLDILVVVDNIDKKPYERPLEGMRALRGLKIAKDIIVYTKDEFETLSSDVTTLCYKIRNEGVKLYEAA